jgi:hypothetical protein
MAMKRPWSSAGDRRFSAKELSMSKNQSQGPGTQNNPQGIPTEGHGGSNTKGGGGGNPQNTNTKGSGAQKRQQQKKR